MKNKFFFIEVIFQIKLFYKISFACYIEWHAWDEHHVSAGEQELVQVYWEL